MSVETAARFLGVSRVVILARLEGREIEGYREANGGPWRVLLPLVPAWVSVRTVARFYGKSPAEIRGWCRSGELLTATQRREGEARSWRRDARSPWRILVNQPSFSPKEAQQLQRMENEHRFRVSLARSRRALEKKRD